MKVKKKIAQKRGQPKPPTEPEPCKLPEPPLFFRDELPGKSFMEQRELVKYLDARLVLGVVRADFEGKRARVMIKLPDSTRVETGLLSSRQTFFVTFSRVPLVSHPFSTYFRPCTPICFFRFSRLWNVLPHVPLCPPSRV
jgi:hypothetical protein